jgi:hypothetical protein
VRTPGFLLFGGAILAGALLAPLAGPALPAGAATSAATLYKEAMAATTSWSVHYVSAGTVSKVTVLESGDAGPASGTQEVLIGRRAVPDSASIIVIGGITYLKGNASALIDLTGLTASQAAATAGKWFQFATDNKEFSQIVVGVRSRDVAQELALKGPYTLGPARRLHGYAVDAILGTQHIAGLKNVREVLYVRANGRHLPVEEETVNVSGKPNGIENTTYSDWGEKVRPQAPAAIFTIGPVNAA